jgi:hypothetical protein
MAKHRTGRLVWLLLGLVVIVTLLASAIPLDPSWTKGVYDDGDFDDLLAYLTSGSAAICPAPVADGRAPHARHVTDPPPPEPVALAPSDSSHAPRGPPAS